MRNFSECAMFGIGVHMKQLQIGAQTAEGVNCHVYYLLLATMPSCSSMFVVHGTSQPEVYLLARPSWRVASNSTRHSASSAPHRMYLGEMLSLSRRDTAGDAIGSTAQGVSRCRPRTFERLINA